MVGIVHPDHPGLATVDQFDMIGIHPFTLHTVEELMRLSQHAAVLAHPDQWSRNAGYTIHRSADLNNLYHFLNDARIEVDECLKLFYDNAVGYRSTWSPSSVDASGNFLPRADARVWCPIAERPETEMAALISRRYVAPYQDFRKRNSYPIAELVQHSRAFDSSNLALTPQLIIGEIVHKQGDVQTSGSAVSACWGLDIEDGVRVVRLVYRRIRYTVSGEIATGRAPHLMQRIDIDRSGSGEGELGRMFEPFEALSDEELGMVLQYLYAAPPRSVLDLLTAKVNPLMTVKKGLNSLTEHAGATHTQVATAMALPSTAHMALEAAQGSAGYMNYTEAQLVQRAVRVRALEGHQQLITIGRLEHEDGSIRHTVIAYRDGPIVCFWYDNHTMNNQVLDEDDTFITGWAEYTQFSTHGRKFTLSENMTQTEIEAKVHSLARKQPLRSHQSYGEAELRCRVDRHDLIPESDRVIVIGELLDITTDSSDNALIGYIDASGELKYCTDSHTIAGRLGTEGEGKPEFHDELDLLSDWRLLGPFMHKQHDGTWRNSTHGEIKGFLQGMKPRTKLRDASTYTIEELTAAAYSSEGLGFSRVIVIGELLTPSRQSDNAIVAAVSPAGMLTCLTIDRTVSGDLGTKSHGASGIGIANFNRDGNTRALGMFVGMSQDDILTFLQNRPGVYECPDFTEDQLRRRADAALRPAQYDRAIIVRQKYREWSRRGYAIVAAYIDEADEMQTRIVNEALTKSKYRDVQWTDPSPDSHDDHIQPVGHCKGMSDARIEAYVRALVPGAHRHRSMSDPEPQTPTIDPRNNHTTPEEAVSYTEEQLRRQASQVADMTGSTRAIVVGEMTANRAAVVAYIGKGDQLLCYSEDMTISGQPLDTVRTKISFKAFQAGGRLIGQFVGKKGPEIKNLVMKLPEDHRHGTQQPPQPSTSHQSPQPLKRPLPHTDRETRSTKRRRGA